MITTKLIGKDLEEKCPGLIEVTTELAWNDNSLKHVLLNLPNVNQIFTPRPTISVHVMLLHSTSIAHFYCLGSPQA